MGSCQHSFPFHCDNICFLPKWVLSVRVFTSFRQNNMWCRIPGMLGNLKFWVVYVCADVLDCAEWLTAKAAAQQSQAQPLFALLPPSLLLSSPCSSKLVCSAIMRKKCVCTAPPAVPELTTEVMLIIMVICRFRFHQKSKGSLLKAKQMVSWATKLQT